MGDPNYGNTGFDNLGQAALLMVQVSDSVAFVPERNPLSFLREHLEVGRNKFCTQAVEGPLKGRNDIVW